MTKKQRYTQMLNELSNPEDLEYLTVECSTRSAEVAAKAKELIEDGSYAEALKIADPIAYNVGFNDFE